MLARLIVVPPYLISWIAFAAEAPITIKVMATEIASIWTTGASDLAIRYCNVS
jgi:hypothetical protein